jgi:hypothetical protein
MECKVSGIINRLKKKGRHLPVGDTKYASSTFICLFILHHYFTLSSFFFSFVLQFIELMCRIIFLLLLRTLPSLCGLVSTQSVPSQNKGGGLRWVWRALH